MTLVTRLSFLGPSESRRDKKKMKEEEEKERLATAGSDKFEVEQDAKDVDDSHKSLTAARNAKNWAIFKNEDHPLKKIMNELGINRSREPTQKERRDKLVKVYQQNRNAAEVDTKHTNDSHSAEASHITCSPPKRLKSMLAKTKTCRLQSTPVKSTIPSNELDDQGISGLRSTNHPGFQPMAPTDETLTTEEFLSVLDASVESAGFVALQTVYLPEPQIFEYNHIADTVARDTLINFNVVNNFVRLLEQRRGRIYNIYLPQQIYQMIQFEETRIENGLLILQQPVQQTVMFTGGHYFAVVRFF